MGESSPVAEAFSWARAEIARRVQEDGSVQIGDVASAMVEHFGAQPEFVRTFLDQQFRPICYDVAQRATARTRGSIVFGDTVMSRDEFTEEVQRRRPRWQAWLDRLEYVGDKHIPVGQMRSAELLAAAQERRRRGEAEFAVAVVLEQLEVKVRRGNRRVADVWTEDQIASLVATLDVTVDATARLIAPLATAAD